MLKERYGVKGAQTWIQEIENIFRVMACNDARKMLFGPHLLSEEAKLWWQNTRQRLEAGGTVITWNNFKKGFWTSIF